MLKGVDGVREREGQAGVNFRLECERAGKCPVSAERGRWSEKKGKTGWSECNVRV